MTGRVITSIDGFNLYFGMKDAGYRRYSWLDLVALSRGLLKADQCLAQARSFTSRVKADPSDAGKTHRQAAYLDALATLPQLSIAYGHYLSKPMQCRSCGATWTRREEKMTDVNIACGLLEDAYLDRFDTALIISGDSDLTPPIRLIRTASPGQADHRRLPAPAPLHQPACRRARLSRPGARQPQRVPTAGGHHPGQRACPASSV